MTFRKQINCVVFSAWNFFRYTLILIKLVLLKIVYSYCTQFKTHLTKIELHRRKPHEL